MRTISKLLRIRNQAGNYIDFQVLVNCTDNGSKIETEIVKLKDSPKMKVTAR